jgi:hypothetical protein
LNFGTTKPKTLYTTTLLHTGKPFLEFPNQNLTKQLGLLSSKSYPCYPETILLTITSFRFSANVINWSSINF